MSTLDVDLNATIGAAVNAKIEAAVMQALAGDEVMGAFVAAALNQKVETDRYDRKKDSTFLAHVVKEAIQKATKAAVESFVAAEREAIELEVRKALRSSLPKIASDLVGGLRSSAYAVTVHVKDYE
jgi:hypothetical protein